MKSPNRRCLKWAVAVCGCFGLAFVGIVVMGNRAIVAASSIEPVVHVEDDEFASLASVLRVAQKKLSIKFPTAPKEVNCSLDFYSGGQKLAGHLALEHQDTGRREKVYHLAISIVDLDYLKLGEAEPGHCRWEIQLGTKSSTERSQAVDIPKTDVDSSKTFTWGTFRNPKQMADGFPVIWITGRSKDQKIRIGSTAEELVTNNPGTEFAIVTLRTK